MRGFTLGTILLLSACTAKLSGELSVDGGKFDITACRSGQALGFSGVQFVDGGGRQLRLLANPDGTTNIALFQAGAARGDTLGNCGTLAMQAQNSRINSIVNLRGSANLSCEGGGHKISGKIEFANCH